MPTSTLDNLKDGDLIGFSGKGLVSDLINIGTYALPRWGLSHVGIYCRYQGIPYIFESTTLFSGKPCAFAGKPISGVQAHPISDILTRPGKVWHYPLSRPLSPSRANDLRKLLRSKIGTPYDMAGALRQSGFLLRCFGAIFRKPDITMMDCSELSAWAYNSIDVRTFFNFSSESPNSLARELLRTKVVFPRRRLK